MAAGQTRAPTGARTRRRTPLNCGRRARRIGTLALVGTLLGGASAFGSSGASASSPGGHAGSSPLPPRIEAKVRNIIYRFRNTTRTPGALIGIWSPKGKFVSSSGVANLATGRPLNTRMQFKIASQTKTFTGDLILQLVGEGKVSLSDHISKWIAGVPNGDRITIRELLNHTSGLGNGFDLPAVTAQIPTGCSVDFPLATEATVPPLAAPGVKFSYSNYGYNLLGRVVELATGEDLSTAIQNRIAKPLGLHRTLLPSTVSDDGLSPPFTHGYGTGEVTPTQAPTAADDSTELPGSCLWAHGGMVSTLHDMRVWSKALATGALVKPAVWKKAKKDALPVVFGGNYNGPGRWKYALGFVKSAGFMGGEGSFLGYESTAMYSPARHTAIEVVSTKQPNAITPPPMFQALAMAVFGKHIGFGLTPAQALKPNDFGAGPDSHAKPRRR
jgi:D-alanyl-D-alanine carboxypeptidase